MSEECSVDVLILDHDPPEDFGECMCDSSPSAVYLVIRDLIALCQFGTLVGAFVSYLRNESLKVYIYFDFWTQVLLFFSSEMGLYGIVRRCSEGEDGDGWDSLPWYCRVYWALLSAALPSTCLSTILYWTQVYKKNNPEVSSLVMNTVSPMVAFLEFMLLAFPIRLLNFFYFVLFYLIYVLFSLAYQKRGEDDQGPIYKVVDWKDSKKAILNCFYGLAIGLAAYFIICFISMAKMACRNRNDY